VNDPIFSEDVKSTTPNFGSGVYVNSDKMFAGISIPQMINSSDPDVIQEKPVFIYGGYVFELSTFLKLRPSMLAKIVNGKAVEWDISASVLLNEILWVGFAYRPNNALSLQLQMQATEQLQIGYAYDITLNELRTADLGSHEIMINFRFHYSQKGIMSPRYF
jgi:type IX secretion system PorP/SprF family membrane protein